MKSAHLPLALALLSSVAVSQELLVSGYNSNGIHRYNPKTGAFLGKIAGVPGAQSMNYGPDGNLYVCAEKVNKILRLDGQTGALLGDFVFDDPLTPSDETGGLDGPTAAVFSPEGDLFVASFNTDSVLRYDGATGAFLQVFVGPSGPLNGPDAGMTFGPDGHLYVPSFNSNAVLRYDCKDGSYLGAFVPAGSGGLVKPRMLRFRSDGWLYVSSWGSAGIKRYDASGAYVDTLVTTSTPTGFLFQSGSGDLLVCSDNQHNVRRFSGVDGSLLGVHVKKGAGGLNGATYLQFLPDQELKLVPVLPGVAGALATLAIHGASSSAVVLYAVGTQTDSLWIGLSPPIHLGVLNPKIHVLVTDAVGSFSATAMLDPSLAGQTLVQQVFDPLMGRISNQVIQTF